MQILITVVLPGFFLYVSNSNNIEIQYNLLLWYRQISQQTFCISRSVNKKGYFWVHCGYLLGISQLGKMIPNPFMGQECHIIFPSMGILCPSEFPAMGFFVSLFSLQWVFCVPMYSLQWDFLIPFFSPAMGFSCLIIFPSMGLLVPIFSL